MKLAKLNLQLVGKTIATEIKSKDGQRLINGGTLITDKVVERLQNYGMNTVYIEDENHDVQLIETIGEAQRIIILNQIRDIFKDASKGIFDEYKVQAIVRNEILTELKLEPVSISIGKSVYIDDLAEHALNVSLFSMATARQYGLISDKVETIGKAALLHDIGKIISKTDKDHAQTGYEFLKTRSDSVLMYTSVRCHHETLDGNGPLKFKPENINEMMRILCLCNYYENLTKKNLLPHQCFEQIQALVNVKFDQAVFDAFRKSVYLYPVGLPITLSNDESGIVLSQNKTFPARPIVKTDNNQYDLLHHLSLLIKNVNL